MAGKNVTPAAGGRGGAKKNSTSRSAKAGLQFPRIGAGALVYMAAVLEYLATEVLSFK
ncbi:hypothetical protein T492DRAFT_900815 [Pavlovales sp. CCMP2436]|nr:hypothetical protein T492DRAFT_900815 [Pavlovales sp. CCMP2436]